MIGATLIKQGWLFLGRDFVQNQDGVPLRNHILFNLLAYFQASD